MKNITVSVDDETAAWARVYAARRNISLSRYVGELLHSTMQESRAYEDAMHRYLSQKPFSFSGDPVSYPKREELYDRGMLQSGDPSR